MFTTFWLEILTRGDHWGDSVLSMKVALRNRRERESYVALAQNRDK